MKAQSLKTLKDPLPYHPEGTGFALGHSKLGHDSTNLLVYKMVKSVNEWMRRITMCCTSAERPFQVAAKFLSSPQCLYSRAGDPAAEKAVNRDSRRGADRSLHTTPTVWDQNASHLNRVKLNTVAYYSSMCPDLSRRAAAPWGARSR